MQGCGLMNDCTISKIITITTDKCDNAIVCSTSQAVITIQGVTLFINNVTGSGNYFQTNQTHVPAFLPVPRNITVHEGDTAHLKCRIKNLGTKTVGN